MKLRQKLIMGFVAIALIYVVVGYISVRHSTYVGSIFNSIKEVEVPSLTALLEMKAAARQASIKAMEYSLRGEERSALKTREALQKLDKNLAQFKDAEKEEKRAQALIGNMVREYKFAVNEYLALHAVAGQDALLAKEADFHKTRKELIHVLYDQIEYEQKELEDAQITSDNAIKDMIMITLISAVGVLCLAVGSGLYISYAISSPIIKLKNVAVEVGKGDLSTVIEVKGKDELGELAASFNQMVAGLREMDKLKVDRNDLEEIVIKRTAEIQQAMEALEAGNIKLNKSQKAMLYMVEDLNRQSGELKSAHEEIVRSEKLASIGQLASSVAHELRNPLGVMKNVVYYLNMLEIGKENAEVKENLDILSKEISHSDKIITDILEFSRIKKPTLSQENINEVVEESLKKLEMTSGVNIAKELDGSLPDIELDPLQVQQVFVNIAQNALHSMDSGGKLDIRTVLNGEFIETSFADTGIGISEEDKKKIFNPLFSNKINGTGLGLSVCLSFIEGHGGSIDVESEVGKGSVFTVKLPVNRA